jgi:hypothetical protein
MESGEDEEEWERRDAQKQAQRKAELLQARQVSNPSLSFGSSPHEQTRQEAGFWPARQNTGNHQTPFVFTNSTASFPGVTKPTSNFSPFASSADTPAPRSVKVEQPLVFPPSLARKSINASPFETAQTSSMFSQYRSEVSDSPANGHRPSGPFSLAQAMQDRAKPECSGSPQGQQSQVKIKVEETRQGSPNSIKVEETSCLPESRGDGSASATDASQRPSDSMW